MWICDFFSRNLSVFKQNIRSIQARSQWSSGIHSCGQKGMSRTLCKQWRWELSRPKDKEHSNERVPRCCRKDFATFFILVHADGTDKGKFEVLWVSINGVRSCGLSITSPEDCGEVLESQWPEEFVNPNLNTLHTHLTFSIHLKWTALRNDTLYEADPCKIAINKVCANKHSKYLLR